jgi:hypothetical protein
MARDDSTLTTAELAEVLGTWPTGDFVATHDGDWRREGLSTWRFYWHPGCEPEGD